MKTSGGSPGTTYREMAAVELRTSPTPPTNDTFWTVSVITCSKPSWSPGTISIVSAAMLATASSGKLSGERDQSRHGPLVKPVESTARGGYTGMKHCHW